MKRCALLVAVVGLAACKADLHHTVDALPADGTTDTLSTMPGDPPASAVKLTITRGGMPVPAVAVFFQTADSSLVSASLTDDKGLAWALAPAGSFVTAREHRGTNLDELTTFSGAQPGDALTLELDPTGSLSEVTFSLTVQAQANAASYQVHTPCGLVAMSSTTEDITLTGCGTTTDLVIVPIDVDSNVLGAMYIANVTLNGGAIQIAGVYQNLATTTISYSNVPASVQYLGVYEAVSADRPAFEQTAGTNPASGSASTSVLMPSTSATELTATSEMPVSSEVGQQLIYHWHDANLVYNLDLASVQLPPYASAPTYDPASRTLAWTERAGAVEPELVRARIHVYRDDIPAGRAWGWRIAAPRSGTSIAYPKLPIVDFDFNPAAGDAIGVDDLTTISLPGGYAGFHTTAFADVRRAISGTLGRIVTQSLYVAPL